MFLLISGCDEKIEQPIGRSSQEVIVPEPTPKDTKQPSEQIINEPEPEDEAEEINKVEQQPIEEAKPVIEEDELNYIQDQCIYIKDFHFNAEGDDNFNLNDEYVILGNRCLYSIDLTDWTIKDDTTIHTYRFPSFKFQKDSAFTLYTGTGTNTDIALYWGRIPGKYAAVWNNGGDTLFLRDSDGMLVLIQGYSGY